MIRSQAEVAQLQRENRALRGEEGAAGGPSFGPSNIDVQSHMFAQELRTAASSAEHSLRYKQIQITLKCLLIQ